MSGDTSATTPAPLATARALRQTAWITAAAVFAYVGIRSLPVDGGALHYTDFGADAKGLLEFCEPGGPQFVPVDRVRSPVELALRIESVDAGSARVRAGESARLVAVLTAASGRPVTDGDLLVVHTEKLHLLLVDPSLDDYQHLHPTPTGVPGEFAFTFTPRRAGEYRIFADFVPRATGRALYAGARLAVEPASAPIAPDIARVARINGVATRVDGLEFFVRADRERVRINETAELSLHVQRVAGGAAELEEIMGARAHLVVFDAGRTGFAHLHPIASVSGGAEEALRFQLQLSDPGEYRLWVQVKVDGREVFAPFGFSAAP